MKRVDFLNSIVKHLQIYDKDVVAKFSDYATQNQSLNEKEFYQGIKENFPWLEYEFKRKQTETLNKIANCMVFFVVITVISIIIAVVVAVSAGNSI
jgi:hypothetical protein